MEKKDYSPLFTPFKIGKMEIKNRLVLSPMGHNASLPYGAKSDWEIDYFEEHRDLTRVLSTAISPSRHTPTLSREFTAGVQRSVSR